MMKTMTEKQIAQMDATLKETSIENMGTNVLAARPGDCDLRCPLEDIAEALRDAYRAGMLAASKVQS